MILALFLLLAPSAYAERILIVGDSHSCGSFGVQLVKRLAVPDNDVFMYCAPGRSAQHFITGAAMQGCKMFSSSHPKLEPCDHRTLAEIIKEHRPLQKIIPAFGSNDLGLWWLKSFAKVAAQIKEEGAKCDWVGPPIFNWQKGVCLSKYQAYSKDQPKIIAAIKAGTKNVCRFIDSFKYTNVNSTSDCIHRGGQPAMNWANSVANEIRREPLKREAPTTP